MIFPFTKLPGSTVWRAQGLHFSQNVYCVWEQGLWFRHQKKTVQLIIFFGLACKQFLDHLIIINRSSCISIALSKKYVFDDYNLWNTYVAHPLLCYEHKVCIAWKMLVVLESKVCSLMFAMQRLESLFSWWHFFLFGRQSFF